MPFHITESQTLVIMDVTVTKQAINASNPTRATLLVTIDDSMEEEKRFLLQKGISSVDYLMVEISASTQGFYHSKLPICPDIFHTMELRDRRCRLLLRPKKIPVMRSSAYEHKLFVAQIRLIDYYYGDTLPFNRTYNAVQTIERYFSNWLKPRTSAVRIIEEWWQPIYLRQLRLKQNRSAYYLQALWKGYVVRCKLRRLHQRRYRDKMHSLIECSICLDTLRRPVTNTCGHSWCYDCHQGLWAASRTAFGSNKARCPLCRESTRAELRPNLRLEALISMLSA